MATIDGRGVDAHMRRRLQRRGPDGEHGAIAVATAIIVAFALVPVSALALGTYVRSGVQSEMQRSADAGSLAGASALALTNLALIQTGTPELDQVLPTFPQITDVLGSNGLACNAAKLAAGIDNTLSTLNPNTNVTCDATYAKSPEFAGCVSNILGLVPDLTQPVDVNKILGQLPVVVNPPVPLPVPLPGGLPVPVVVPVPAPVVPVTKMVQDTLNPYKNAVQNLLPAFLENGVQVELTYNARGPVDSVFNNGPGTTATAVSTSRRRFKPLLPQVPSQLAPAQTLVVFYIQELLANLKGVVGQTGGTVTLPPELGLDPIVVPTINAVGLKPTCKAAAIDLVDDLSDALTVSPDQTANERLNCLLTGVLGLDPAKTVQNVVDNPLGIPRGAARDPRRDPEPRCAAGAVPR